MIKTQRRILEMVKNFNERWTHPVIVFVKVVPHILIGVDKYKSQWLFVKNLSGTQLSPSYKKCLVGVT